MAFEPTVVSSEQLATSHVFDVERLVLDDDGETFTREVVRHRGAVAVLAYDGRDVVLVRQWRAPLAQAILEIPAGTCDVDGEDLEATAHRELEEEAGLRAGSLERLGTFWNSPGWSDQATVIFLATKLTEVPRRPDGPEERALDVVRLPLGDARALIGGTEPCDSSTAIAILALVARLDA
ncbi:MAG TPA: NUDIX hydrolase [Acidimicrobiales bacterium]|nr:NUDIX hydrolase [Acidimicrobiales bacterium]